MYDKMDVNSQNTYMSRKLSAMTRPYMTVAKNVSSKPNLARRRGLELK